VGYLDVGGMKSLTRRSCIIWLWDYGLDGTGFWYGPAADFLEYGRLETLAP
jgi:hypothetical protein